MRKHDSEHAPKAYDPAENVDEDAPTTAQNPAELHPADSTSTLETVQENAREAAGQVLPGDPAYKEPKPRKTRKSDKK